MTSADTNPVVRLCAEGIAAEAAGRLDNAHALYEQAWEQRADDWDACVVAHYLARHQPTLALRLHWNQEALRYATAVADERVRDFLPSLHLNVGYAHELLGDTDTARQHYAHAAAALDPLAPGPYRDMIHASIANHLARHAVDDVTKANPTDAE